jgi:hypothetical protein
VGGSGSLGLAPDIADGQGIGRESPVGGNASSVSWTIEGWFRRFVQCVAAGTTDRDSIEGAYSLVPGGIFRQEMHLRIGGQLRLLRQEQPDNGGRLHHLHFQTVRQLNLGTKFMTSEAEMIDLAELNYQAAELAVQRSSFFPASDCLRASLDLLP